MPSILPVVDTDALRIGARRRTPPDTGTLDHASEQVLRGEIAVRRPCQPFDRNVVSPQVGSAASPDSWVLPSAMGLVDPAPGADADVWRLLVNVALPPP